MPKLPSAGMPVVSIAEMKGASAVNGFTTGVQISPIDAVIGYLTGYHTRVLNRLRFGFGFTHPSGAGSGKAGEHKHGEDFEFEERVRVEEHGLRIEIDVKVRRGADHHPHHPEPASAPDPADYEEWLRGQVTILSDALVSLGSTDPFGIASAMKQIQQAGAGDLTALSSAHDSVLERFDAMMTMLQKATGDRADILQMVLWNRDLTNSTSLAGLPSAINMRGRLQKFIDAVEARTAHLSGYGALLLQISPDLQQVASTLGASAALAPLIDALSTAGLARTQEKAHRNLLLALQQMI
jgi:hypothetical protein